MPEIGRRRLYFCAFIILQLTSWTQCLDVCDGPFSDFLGCLAEKLNSRFQQFELESAPDVQARIGKCFSQNQCAVPDFRKSSVSDFLSEPWSSRVTTVLDLLENTDHRVQRCMIRYFNSIAQRKIEACVRQYGAPDVRNFEMSTLPEFQSMDITKLKLTVLNRMVVTNQTMECSKTVSSNENLQEIIDCTKAARISQSETPICKAKENCEKLKISGLVCIDRFKKVEQGACSCLEAERNDPNAQKLQNWKELKESFFQGGMEKEYRKCHERNNLPYPQQRVDEAKKAVKQSVGDVLLRGGLPDQVKTMMRILAESLREMKGVLIKSFCQTCQQENVLSTGEQEAQQIRNLANDGHQQPNPSSAGGNAAANNQQQQQNQRTIDFFTRFKEVFGNK